MPRPPDHYTHAQFETIDSENTGETVRCVHCQQWHGSIKALSRKKEHLLKCNAYATWRAAGNGQDLAPPNKYSKRDSLTLNDPDSYSSPYGDTNTPIMSRNRTLNIVTCFEEFWDDSSTQKCMRARCKYCGFVRAKNSTRQFEHLQQCNEFHNSTEGQQALADGSLMMGPADDGPSHDSSGRGDIFKGRAPNPNLMINRQTSKGRPSGGRPNVTPVRPPPAKPTPSLVKHLLAKERTSIEQATQLPFLSHAGCGTLSSTALQQWLIQQGHISRALCTFIGCLIGKIRLTDTKNPSQETSWRALDLLVSTINNAKRELEFLRNTQAKYGLSGPQESPKPATKGFTDLFASVTAPSSSLLEGMVVLWSVEYLYCLSWQYAGTFVQPGPPSSTSYSLPSYLNNNQYDVSSYGQSRANDNADNSHTAALHEALIPNWTSQGFSKFVDACKSIVDELANAQTSGNGAAELSNCEVVFKQVTWLWKQMWPEVTGMGEENEPATDSQGPTQPNENGNRIDGPIEIPDDDEADRDEDAPNVESPYGGTGLAAVAAANRVE